MTSTSSAIADLLLECEDKVPAAKYETDPNIVVRIDSEGRDIFVISDLHLAAGRRKDRRFAGTENFFADDSFKRFLESASKSAGPGKGLLIINGDFIDFLRITDGPRSDDDFVEWQRTLARIGVHKTFVQLKASVSRSEVMYERGQRPFKIWRRAGIFIGILPMDVGLKTHDFKSVWKLAAVVKGHAQFFQGLADWLDQGNRIIIVKGNHDLEWYWQPVRNCMRLALAEKIAAKSEGDREANTREALATKVIPQLRFIDDSMILDEDFFVEHGHRYDRYTTVLGQPVIDGTDELNIPFGSFLNRYLINFIELDYPYLDNVRPSRNILPMLIRERFPLALKLLFGHTFYVIKIIPKGYFRYMFSRLFTTVLAIGIPAAIVVYYQWQTIGPLITGSSAAPSASTPGEFVWRHFLDVVKNFGWLALSYVLARVTAYFQLEEPDSLAKDGLNKMAEHPEYRLITFGHTHNPDQIERDGRWFYNTGTWIPIVETSTADVREDKTYTVLYLRHDPGGKLEPGLLYRWDDEAGRLEEAVLVERKE